MGEMLQVARKELNGFFASPVAYIFLGAFLAVSLFVFFWVETFFARNIADMRPLFEWMPILLIFLVATLTMRMWSEERRAGTIEILLTLPVAPIKLVLGKFLACLALVAIALALTFPIPLIVSWLGPLDWGPVWGAYLASLFLAAAYIAIGLFVSARTDNQIVSLIGTLMLGTLLYLLGAETLTNLVGHRASEYLHLLGTGSRFQSITRGVIDARDLYYYLSLVGVFLALNIYILERLRWEGSGEPKPHHRLWGWVTLLAAANLLAANLWLQQLGWVRADITQGRIYSISETTVDYLSRLQEPLLIRGYFSAHTHPLLAPLVPQLRDLMREYEIAGKGRIRVEIIDPHDNPELEREAGEKYGIRPVAFQTMSKYQAGVVNSYFDILIAYGGEHEVLGYRDLIDVKLTGDTNLDVRLRNPEYDITRSIKKVLYGYQGGGDIFAGIQQPVTLKAFISAASVLPEPLLKLQEELVEVAKELRQQAKGKFEFSILDPMAGDGRLAKEIAEQYGFQPMALSLLDPNTFYFYLLLESRNQVVPLTLPESLDKAGLQRSLNTGLKRFASGLLRSVALSTPAPANPYGLGGERFSLLEERLRQNAGLQQTDLKSGQVPEQADLLLVVDPERLDNKQLYAIDQFLMQGGTLVLASSPFNIDLGAKAINARKRPSGLEDWLAHHGIRIEDKLVLDPENTPFPIPVQRRLGGFVVQEVVSLPYPFFPDIRGRGIEQSSGVMLGLDQITLNWPSPIQIDDKANAQRHVYRLLQSSERSWTSDSTEIQPDFGKYGQLGFPERKEHSPQLLAAVVEGRFESYFKGKASPLLSENKAEEADEEEPTLEKSPEKKGIIKGTIDHSPDSARIILIASGSFLGDSALDLALEATRSRYIAPLQLVENLIDWSLEDRGLLAIRGRSHFSRLLYPLERGEQMFWEYFNYGLALGGLALVYMLHRRLRQRRRSRFEAITRLAGDNP